MKKALKHFESVRRPSGNAATEQWEVLVTELEKKLLRMTNSNDDLSKKYKVLNGEVERYSEALVSAKGLILHFYHVLLTFIAFRLFYQISRNWLNVYSTNVVSTLERRCTDVKMTLCAYWDCNQLNIFPRAASMWFKNYYLFYLVCCSETEGTRKTTSKHFEQLEKRK